jgi:hypothetical protein
MDDVQEKVERETGIKAKTRPSVVNVASTAVRNGTRVAAHSVSQRLAGNSVPAGNAGGAANANSPSPSTQSSKPAVLTSLHFDLNAKSAQTSAFSKDSVFIATMGLQNPHPTVEQYRNQKLQLVGIKECICGHSVERHGNGPFDFDCEFADCGCKKFVEKS